MSIRTLILKRVEELEEEARRISYEAGGSRWRVGPLANCECCSQIINDGSVQVLTMDGLLAEYVVYWDPEEILRNLAEDRDVLTRHSLAFDNEECKCGYDYESCPDVLSLARRRGISLGRAQ